MTVFRDINGNEFIALTELSFTHKVNGEKSIKGTVYTGDKVIAGIDRGWSLEFQDELYYITYALPLDNGESVTIEFDAIHEFFYKIGKSSVYTLLNGSNTAKKYLDLIFNGSEYSYQLGVTLLAFEKQNFGMKNRLALFNDFINSTSTEFKVVGKTVTISEKVGSDLSTIVRKGFNMQDLGLEHNIGDFVTYARGFGAFYDEEDESKGRLQVEYISPLAKMYGKLEADPIVDERFTNSNNLYNKVKTFVDSSYSISVTLTVEDLQKAGYKYAFPRPGDYILAINEELDFQQKIRIVGIDESFDVQGNSVDKSVTCNSLNVADQKNVTDSTNSKNWSDIADGVKQIPNDWLSDAIQSATSDLLNAQTELKFTKNGILAVDKNDSNRLVIMNSAGLGVSTDGGKTFGSAITAEGVNASAIHTGILKAIDIEGVTITGSEINGGKIRGAEIIQETQDFPNNLVLGMQRSALRFYKSASDAEDPNKKIIAIWGDKSTNGTLIINVNDRFYFRMYGDGHSEMSTSKLLVLGDFAVSGSKNAIHLTRDGVRATPAYETAESYLGDIGRSVTNSECMTWVPIDAIFGDTVNLDIPYEVFLQSYDNANVWISDFKSDAFLVCSDKPDIRFVWELKAKRRGYENERLILSEDANNKKIEQIWGPEKYKEIIREDGE
ncbi:phage tail protein [Enterococcus malodoratus]|uniref:phage tail protein n=1 Tax=Enterococcus malodoratus TaxID=71451 RepID=UPI003FD6A75D